GVVERDHAPVRSKVVDESWVPVIEVAAEVLQQDKRHIAVTEVAVGILDPGARRGPVNRSLCVRGRGSACGDFARGAHGAVLPSCMIPKSEMAATDSSGVTVVVC